MTRTAFRSMLGEILQVDPGVLHDSDTRATVTNWTSLADVQIMAVMAGDLGLDQDVELMVYDSVGELLDLLEARGAFDGV